MIQRTGSAGLVLVALAWSGAAVAQDARATLEATIGYDAIADELDTFRGSGLGFGAHGGWFVSRSLELGLSIDAKFGDETVVCTQVCLEPGEELHLWTLGATLRWWPIRSDRETGVTPFLGARAGVARAKPDVWKTGFALGADAGLAVRVVDDVRLLATGFVERLLLGIAFDDDFEGSVSGTHVGVRLGAGILIF